MREFFHGWRRKWGCVALVLALAFMGAWLRSLSTTEIVEFARGTATTDIYYSFDSSFVWRKVYQEWPDLESTFQSWESLPRSKYDFFKDDRIKWTCHCCGSGLGKQIDGPNDSSIFVIVHYSAIVIPLALLSAYLLLVTPRKRASFTLGDRLIREPEQP